LYEYEKHPWPNMEKHVYLRVYNIYLWVYIIPFGFNIIILGLVFFPWVFFINSFGLLFPWVSNINHGRP